MYFKIFRFPDSETWCQPFLDFKADLPFGVEEAPQKRSASGKKPVGPF